VRRPPIGGRFFAAMSALAPRKKPRAPWPLVEGCWAAPCVAYTTFESAESALPDLSPPARTLGSLFGSFGKMLIVLGDPQHRFLGLRLIHLLRDGARLFRTLSPVSGVVDEGRRHVGTSGRGWSRLACCCQASSTPALGKRAEACVGPKFTFAAAPASLRRRLPTCLRAWRAPPRAKCERRCAPPLEWRNRRRDRRGWWRRASNNRCSDRAPPSDRPDAAA
jgi:hypothetical protein